MKNGDLISIVGNIYEYDFKSGTCHIVYEILIDEDGYLTPTYTPRVFTDEELKDNAVSFTQQQWYGIVEHFIRQDYDYLTEEDIETAVEDIVDRCFAMNMPEFNELQGYIACYMNR